MKAHTSEANTGLVFINKKFLLLVYPSATQADAGRSV